MRAKEFITELSVKPGGKMHPHHAAVQQGAILARDVGGYDRTYHMNRLLMAAAIADGSSKKPIDIDDSSFVEKYNVIFPYTDIEHMMMLQAMATIPTDGGELQKRGKSKEPEDTYTVSPVSNWNPIKKKKKNED
jgi:hypothetical protein